MKDPLLKQEVIPLVEKDDFRTTFREALKSTIIPEDAPNKEESYMKLVNMAKENMPPTLFRYRSCNTYNLDAFLRNSIYCVKASEFNDIHDSAPYYDKTRIIELLRRSLWEENPSILWEYYNTHHTLPVIGASLPESIKAKLIELLSLPQKEFMTRVGSNNFINSDVKDLNEMMSGSISQLRDSSRIACFCEDYDSLLMWAHYADYHKGFVLEYTKDEIINTTKDKTDRIFPVIYSDDRYNAEDHLLYELQTLLSKKIMHASDIPMPDGCVLEKIYLYKAQEWSYEKEWRLFYSDLSYLSGSNSSLYELTNIKPKAIYYGARMDSANRSLLSHFARMHDIEEYEMKVDHSSRSFKLISKRVTKNE